MVWLFELAVNKMFLPQTLAATLEKELRHRIQLSKIHIAIIDFSF
jgi:hypothetical protein